MWRKIILTAIASIGIACTGMAQYFTINLDSQSPAEQPVIDRAFSGNSIFLRAYCFDSGVAVDLTPWTMTFRYFYGQYSTQGCVTVNGTTSSNRVDFTGLTNIYAKPFNDYYWSISGIKDTGLIKTFGTGTLKVEYDPATSTNIVTLMEQVNISWMTNWTGAQVESNRVAIALQRTQFDATSNATTLALGTLTTNLAIETSRATNAETVVSNFAANAISAETSRATNAEAVVSNYVNTAVAVEMTRATNAEAVLQGNIDAISVSSSNAIFRYFADAVSNVTVLANGQGVTNVLSGTTHTFTVPAGVKIFSASIKWNNSVANSFTVVLAEGSMNTTALNRRAAIFQAYRTDTDPWAPVTGASCRPSSTLFGNYSVIGLATTPNTVVDCEFQW